MLNDTFFGRLFSFRGVWKTASSMDLAFHVHMVQFYPWFIFIILCFKLIIRHNYHTLKQRKIKFKPRIKWNHKLQLYNQRLFKYWAPMDMFSCQNYTALDCFVVY